MRKYTSVYMILCVLVISSLGMAHSTAKPVLIVLQIGCLIALRHAAKTEDFAP
jgi:hypothetical protein